MRISTINTYKSLNVNFAHKKEESTGVFEEKHPTGTSCENCLAQIGKAQVLMQNKTDKVQTEEQILEVLKKIANIHNMDVAFFIDSNLAVKIGHPIKNLKNLYTEDACARCHKDENGCLKEIYFENYTNKDVRIYDDKGIEIKYFTPHEIEALHEYKYSPNSFHDFLRYKKTSYLPTQQDLEEYITLIDNIYKNDSKIWHTEKPMVVYRALQDKLSKEQKENLSKIGGIFKDTSYSSTTQMLETAKRFYKENPILEIELPQNSKYIDLDNIFNIGAKSWREQEFLLNRNSKFLVTGFDEPNKIIKVKYLNND